MTITLKRSGRGREIAKQCVLRIGRQRLREREMPQDGEDIFVGGRERRLQRRRCEIASCALRSKKCHAMLAHRVTARSKRSEPLSAAGRRIARLLERHRDYVRVQHQQHAAIVFAREFAHHQRAQPRRSLPVHVARAVGGNVASQRVQILAAAFAQAFERSLQRGQNLEEISRLARPRDRRALRRATRRGALSAKSQTGSA